MRRSLLSLSTAVATLAVVGTAYACSCIQTTPKERFLSATAVFSGTVETVAMPAHSGSTDVTYSIRVDEVWKSPPWVGLVAEQARVTVISQESTAACGIPMTKGEKYLFYASIDNETGKYRTGFCNGTALYSDSADNLNFLRNDPVADCGYIVCSNDATYPTCTAEGNPINYSGNPCTDPTPDCREVICPNGDRYPTCSEDGHIINYFRDPCGDLGNGVFSDVPRSHTQYEAIVYVKNRGIVQGYPDGTFRPRANIGRAEFVKMLMQAYSSTQVRECMESGRRLPWDVPRDEWFAPYVCAAMSRGIIEGYPDGSFRPGNSLNAAEASKIIVKTFGLTESPSAGSDWYAPYVNALQESNAMPSSYQAPGQLLKRGEMAEILYNIRSHYTR